MIKETCSCGAQFEYSSRLYEEHDAVRDENDRAGMWRVNHRHEGRITVLPDMRTPFPRDWIAGRDGWVWVGDGPQPRTAPAWPPPKPDPVAQPGVAI